MVNKKILPVTFSDEIIEQNEQVGVTHINRAAPVDPGSGSGNGSGSGSGGNFFGTLSTNAPGSGHGVVSSPYGCHWNVSCDFRWYAKYDVMNESAEGGINYYITGIEIDNIENASAIFDGVPYGVKRDGAYYEPYKSIINLVMEMGEKPTVTFTGGCTMGEITVPLNEIELSITKTVYDSYGKPQTSERLRVRKKISFRMIFTNNSSPNLYLHSCEIIAN